MRDTQRVGLAHENRTLGIGLMLAGILIFSVNDALGKWLVSTYTVGQVLLVRSIAVLLVLSPVLIRQGWTALVVPERAGLQILRIVLSTAEVVLFYWSIVYLPLADAMTYYLAAPIFVAALSPVLLGDHVGWRRWTAIMIGFAGVLVALQPSAASLSIPALIALAGSVGFSFMMIMGRLLRGTPDLTLLGGQTVGTLAAGLVSAPFAWVTPTLRDLVLLVLLGITAMVAHLAVTRSLKLADAAVVTPFQYTMLLWAIVFGYFVFGDVPSAAMLAGSAIIVGAGLFILFRERRRRIPTSDPVTPA